MSKQTILTVLCIVFSGGRLWAGATVLPGHSSIDGKSIGAYTADWWNWANSTPPEQDVFSDTTGVNATRNQSGPVFFVAGSQGFGAPPAVYERSFQVPAGKRLLIPLINWVVFPPPDGAYLTTKEEANGLSSGTTDPSKLFAIIDGASVTGLASHQEESGFFTLNVAPGRTNIPPGAFPGSYATGYFLLIEPLAVGDHTLHFGGTSITSVDEKIGFTLDPFTVDVTDHIKVVASPVPLPPAALNGGILLIGMAAFGFIRRRRALNA